MPTVSPLDDNSMRFRPAVSAPVSPRLGEPLDGGNPCRPEDMARIIAGYLHAELLLPLRSMIREELRGHEQRWMSSLADRLTKLEEQPSMEEVEQWSDSEDSFAGQGDYPDPGKARCTTVPCDLPTQGLGRLSGLSSDSGRGHVNRQNRHTLDIIPMSARNITPNSRVATPQVLPAVQRPAARHAEPEPSPNSSGPLTAIMRGFVRGKEKGIGTVRDLENARANAVLENSCLTPSATLQQIPENILDSIAPRVGSSKSLILEASARMGAVRPQLPPLSMGPGAASKSASHPASSSKFDGVLGVPGLMSSLVPSALPPTLTPPSPLLEGRPFSKSTSFSSNQECRSPGLGPALWSDRPGRASVDSGDPQEQQPKQQQPVQRQVQLKFLHKGAHLGVHGISSQQGLDPGQQDGTESSGSPRRTPGQPPGRDPSDPNLPCTPTFHNHDHTDWQGLRQGRSPGASPRRCPSRSPRHATFGVLEEGNEKMFEHTDSDKGQSGTGTCQGRSRTRTSMRPRRRSNSSCGGFFCANQEEADADMESKQSTGLRGQILAALRPTMVDDVQALRLAREEELTAVIMDPNGDDFQSGNQLPLEYTDPTFSPAQVALARQRLKSERRVCSPLWLRLCGVLVAQNKLGRCYRRLVLALAVCAIGMTAERIVNEHSTDSYIRFEVVCDLVMATGTFFGLLALGTLADSNILGSAECMLCSYARRQEVIMLWATVSIRQNSVLALIWISSTTIRATAAVWDGAELGWRETAAIAVHALTSGCFLALVYCILHVCDALAMMVDAYCFYVVSEENLQCSVKEWNTLQAVLRKASGAVENCFFVLQTTALGYALLTMAGLFLHGVPMWWLAVVALLVLSDARLFYAAAQVTEKCSRVPPLINAMSFSGHEIDTGRHYLVEYVTYSAAGFYVGEVRLTVQMALKLSYISGILAFGVVTKLTTGY